MIQRLVSASFALCAVFLMNATAFARDLPDFTELVEKNSPAVVNISTTRKLAGHPTVSPGLRAPEIPEHGNLGDLFRHFFGGEGEPGLPDFFDAESLGSGFIITSDGHVVTNHHVIKQADEVVVRLSDRREFKAEVIGTDTRTDIAVLKIDAERLPTLTLEPNPDELAVGEWVLAIGSPFGFDHSVTAGIVSAKGRSLPSENYVPFIQTDVAINPGNSGGPLFNMDGKVVGINSQIYSRTGGFMGLSFAIPIDVAMDVVAQLKADGRVSRGWLGVFIQPVTQDLAESFGVERPVGALVAEVIPDSPAQSADIRVGDIIVAFGGKEVPSSAALPPIVGTTPVGQVAKVDLIREGQSMVVEVLIGELPEQATVAQKPTESPDDRGMVLGLELTPVPTNIKEAYGLADDGVLVAKVMPGIAYDSGIRSGDVLLKIGANPVTGVEQARTLLSKLSSERPVPVLIHRKQGPIYLALRTDR